MALPHAGSWAGLPDFGITEAIGDFLGAPRNAQGGSQNRNIVPTAINNYQNQAAYNPPVVQQTPYTQNTTKPAGDVLSLQTGPAGTPGGTSPIPTPGPTPTPTAPSGPSGQDQLSAELDAIFNPVFSALQGQEDTLRQNYAPVEGQIQSESTLAQQSLADQQASGLRELAGQETAAGERKTDALSSAARLFNDLQRGGQQRFGGSSSAGEAFQTLTAQEQQRRQGDIFKTFEQAMQQVGTFKANLMDKYQTAVKEVTLQTQKAITDAQAQFRDALQSINSARYQAQADKATASMNALQDLRNKVFTINQQSLQFAQQLALNRDANLKYVDQFTQNALQSVQSGSTAVNQFGTQATNIAGQTSLGVSPGQVASPQVLQTGQVTARRPEDDIFA